MMYRSPGIGSFEFVRLAALRTAQLMRGCTPRVPECHKRTSTAQREVAAGKIIGLPHIVPGAPVEVAE